MHVIIDGFGPLGLRAAARLLGISHSLLHYHLKRGTKPRSCRQREIEDLEAGRHLRPLQVSNTPRPVVIKWSDGWETEFESISELAEMTGRKQSNLSRTLKIMERYGFVSLKREARAVKPVVKATKFLIEAA